MHERSPRTWQPPGFHLEDTSLWSFPDRGSWATHDGSYRGNWSPYIPRNLILRYTRPGDLVLDPFVGGGTTAIEAKLLGRDCVALDINRAALSRTREKTRFGEARELRSPAVLHGDARTLPLGDNVVDLLCAHPPYADIIRCSRDQRGDLSHLPVKDFLAKLPRVAEECYRVIRPGGICAVLMGDTRKHGNVVPLGMETLAVFRAASFAPKEIAIKSQHNTRMGQAWPPRAAAHNFLMLAHEYLFVLTKPTTGTP